MEKFNFLIVTQDERLKKTLHRELSKKADILLFFPHTMDILDAIEMQNIDVLIIDQLKGKEDEIWELCNFIKEKYPLIIKILLSDPALQETDLVQQLNKGTINMFIPRNLSPTIILEEIKECIKCLYPVKDYQEKIKLLESSLRKLNEIGISLSSEHNLSILLNKILKEVRKITNSEAGSLYIVKDNKLSFEAAQNDYIDRRNGPYQKTFQSFTLPLSTKSIAGYVALTGEILNIEDAYNMPKDCPYSFNIEVDKKTGYRCKSMLVVPMKNEKDEIIGVLQLINTLDANGNITTYDKEDEQVVLSLASQAAVAVCNASLIMEIKKLLSSLIEYSSYLIDARSRHTAGHSQRVALYTMEIAEAINKQKEGSFASITFTPEEMEELRFSAYLHDIGKIGVSERVLDKKNKLSDDHMALIKQRFDFIKTLYQINYLKNRAALSSDTNLKISSKEELNKKIEEIDADLEFLKKMNIPSTFTKKDSKRIRQIAQKEYINLQREKKKYLTPFEVKNLIVLQGNLTANERTEIQNHINHTINILSKIPFPKDLKRVPFFAGSHHERLDGCGYPKGLTSEQLPWQSRILALVDFYEALTAPDRPYRKPLTRNKALKILKEEAKKNHCDKNLVQLIEKENLLQL